MTLFAALCLTACANTTVISDYCTKAKPLGLSSRDTIETQAEINGHNAVWEKYCGE